MNNKNFPKFQAFQSTINIKYDCFIYHPIKKRSTIALWGFSANQFKKSRQQRLFFVQQQCQQKQSNQKKGKQTQQNNQKEEKNNQQYLKNDIIAVAEVEIPKPQIDNPRRFGILEDLNSPSPNIWLSKYIIAPGGGTSALALLPQRPDLMASKSEDSRSVYIWSIDKQPDRRSEIEAVENTSLTMKILPSTPDLELTGHTRPSKSRLTSSPLVCCPTSPQIISGSDDGIVLLWDVREHIQTLSSPHAKPGLSFDHSSAISALEWAPTSESIFCSGTEDSDICLWDTRNSKTPSWSSSASSSNTSGLAEITSLSLKDSILAATSYDGYLSLFDIRKSSKKSSSLLQKLKLPNNAIPTCTQWNPSLDNCLAVATSDAQLLIIDTSTNSTLFTHYGHKGAIATFSFAHWNDPNLVLSLSEDSLEGSSSLQIWRPKAELFDI